ncbi:MAG: hypothetical protein IT462_10480 [Planctomycetes bacterium]|nr:hypothetical protein [Planctomycetota bacterium]
MRKPSVKTETPKVPLVAGPRARAHTLIDALFDNAIQSVLPYLEYLMEQQRKAAVSNRAAKVVSNDSMRKDMGI